MDKLSIKFADKDSDIKKLLKNTDAVIGYNTIAMFESAALNIRTISLTIAPVEKSLTAAMKKAGIEIVAPDADKIIDCLNRKKESKRPLNLFEGGIDNCVGIILKELNLN